MRKTTRGSVRFSCETPEDVAFLSDLSARPSGRRNRWLKFLALSGARIPEGRIPVPEPTGAGRGVRMDLGGESPEDRDLLRRVHADFYPGRLLRILLLRGWLAEKASSGAPEREPPASLSSFPEAERLRETLSGLL